MLTTRFVLLGTIFSIFFGLSQLGAQDNKTELVFDDRFYWNGFNGYVTDLIEFQEDLVAVGDFTFYGNKNADKVIKWDGSTWEAIGSGFEFYPDRIFIYKEELYASTRNKLRNPPNSLSKWNGTEWDHFFSVVGDINDYEIFQDNLIIAGDFFIPGIGEDSTGLKRSVNIAQWNGEEWSQLGSGLNERELEAITTFNGNLVAASTNEIFEWNGSNWNTFDSLSIEESSTEYFTIQNLNESLLSVEISNIREKLTWEQRFYSPKFVLWDGEQRQDLGLPFSLKDPSTMISIPFIDVIDDELIVSFNLSSFSGEHYKEIQYLGNIKLSSFRNILARWTDGQWEIIEDNNSQNFYTSATAFMDQLVASVIKPKSSFDRAKTYSEVYSELDKNRDLISDANEKPGLGLNGPVYEIISFDNDIVVGGKFTSSPSKELNHIALFDGNEWHSLGEGLPSFHFNNFVEFDSKLLVSTRDNVLQGDGSNWSIFSDTSVEQLYVYEDILVSVKINESGHRIINKWNGTDWVEWLNVYNSDPVLFEFENQLLVTGINHKSSTKNANPFFYWDGESWSVYPVAIPNVSVPPPGRIDRGVLIRTFSTFNGNLVIAADLNQDFSNNIFMLQDNEWVKLENGKDQEIQGLTEYKDQLYAWGDIDAPSEFGFRSGPVGVFKEGQLKYSEVFLDVYDPINKILTNDKYMFVGGDYESSGTMGNYFSILSDSTSINELQTNNEVNLYPPTNFQLHQNYPNPFNPTTTINFELAEKSRVKLEIFNILGQRVRLLEDSFRTKGAHSITFKAGSLSSGVYLYRLSTGEFTETKKMMLIK